MADQGTIQIRQLQLADYEKGTCECRGLCIKQHSGRYDVPVTAFDHPELQAY